MSAEQRPPGDRRKGRNPSKKIDGISKSTTPTRLMKVAALIGAGILTGFAEWVGFHALEYSHSAFEILASFEEAQ